MRIEIEGGKIYINDNHAGYFASEIAKCIQFKSDRGDKDANRWPFVWETHKGKRMEPKEMATPHLINAVNMLWRNALQIKEDHPEIRDEWTAEYIDRALNALTWELHVRVMQS